MARNRMGALASHADESIGVATSPSTIPLPPPSAESRGEGVARARDVMDIPLGRIMPDPAQPRRSFDGTDLGRLAASLREHGQLQAIRVRWVEPLSSYVIVIGERRWRASRMAGRETIRCQVVEDSRSDSELLEDQLVENCLREDLLPVEKAHAFRTLLDRNGWTYRQLAARLNIDDATVSRSISLLDLPEDVRDSVDRGEMAPSTAYEVSKLAEPAQQREVAALVMEGGLSNRQAAEEVRARMGRRREGHRIVHETEDGIRIRVTGRPGTPLARLVEAMREAAEQHDQALV